MAIPNEYFEGDLSNWDLSYAYGSGSITIDDGKMLIDLDSGEVTSHYAEYGYLCSGGDYELIIDVSDYTPDNANEGFNVEFRVNIPDTDWVESWKDFARIMFHQNNPTTYRINGYIESNDVPRTDVDTDVSSCPTKMKIKRIGTTFYLYYSIGLGWVQVTSYDVGSVATEINRIWLWGHHRASNGGSVKLDNLIVYPRMSLIMQQTNQFNGGAV